MMGKSVNLTLWAKPEFMCQNFNLQKFPNLLLVTLHKFGGSQIDLKCHYSGLKRKNIKICHFWSLDEVVGDLRIHVRPYVRHAIARKPFITFF